MAKKSSSIRVEESALDHLDERAEEHDISRSELIERLAEESDPTRYVVKDHLDEIEEQLNRIQQLVEQAGDG